MSKKTCQKWTVKEILLSDWAFTVYGVLLVWFGGVGSLAAQIWRYGGFSFALSTLDIVRLVVGCAGFSVCVFICFKIKQRKQFMDCEITE